MLQMDIGTAVIRHRQLPHRAVPKKTFLKTFAKTTANISDGAFQI